jgi:hypothetical protein
MMTDIFTFRSSPLSGSMGGSKDKKYLFCYQATIVGARQRVGQFMLAAKLFGCSPINSDK